MKLKKETILLVLLALLPLCYCIYLHATKPKFGYVDLVKVYQEFEFKKEKEKDLLKFDSNNKRVLDSLRLNLESIKRSYDAGIGKADTLVSDYKMNLKYYNSKSNEFDILKDELVAKYDGEIWKQLNQYVNDFSEEHSYDFMFGANGNGAVMYARPGYDVTEDIIKYVNERYHGKK